MWLLLQGWLLRNVLGLLGLLAAATAVIAVLFGARRAGRNAERVETMRGLWRCNAHAAGELDSLPPGSAIEQMLADYQVMRDQARACERFGE